MSSIPLFPCALNVENLKSLHTAAREALLRFRSDFEAEFGIKFPRFDLLLSVLLAADGGPPPPLVALNQGLKNTFDLAMALFGIPSDTIGKFVAWAGEQVRNDRAIACQSWGARRSPPTRACSPRRPELADELIDRFADDFLAGLPARPGKACRGVLFVDTFETLWKESDVGRSVQGVGSTPGFATSPEMCMGGEY